MGRIMPIQVRNPTTPFELIIAWSGAIVDMPTGWRLCDGTRATPDCRDKFIEGGSPLSTGGQDSFSFTHHHPLDAAAISDNETTHFHVLAGQTTSITGGLIGQGSTSVADQGDHSHTFDITTATSTHHHSLVGESEDTALDLDLRPPFMALAYIKGQPDDVPPGSILYFDGALTALNAFTAGATTTTTTDYDPDVDTDVFVADDLGLTPPFLVFLPGGETWYVFSIDGGNPLHWDGFFTQWGPTLVHPAGSLVQQPLYVPCIGASGAPDGLSNFIVGAGDLYAVLDTMGQTEIVLNPTTNEHSHDPDTFAAGTGRHNHDNANVTSSTPSPSLATSTTFTSNVTQDAMPANHHHQLYESTSTVKDPATGNPTGSVNNDANSEHDHTMSSGPGLSNWPYNLDPAPAPHQVVIPTVPQFVRLWPLKKLIY